MFLKYIYVYYSIKIQNIMIKTIEILFRYLPILVYVSEENKYHYRYVS